MIKNFKKYLFLFFLCVFIYKNISSKNPITFEENNGQFSAFKGSSSNKLLFEANLPGLCIWVTEKGLTYNFYKTTITDSVTLAPQLKKQANKIINWYRSEMLLQNANIGMQNVTRKNKLEEQKNYIRGNNFSPIQANLFEELYFTNIYEGIDWRLYVENNQIKQEFIVQPLANPNLINLEYVTTGNIDIKNNEIKLVNALGIFTEGKLLCYQTNKNNVVKASYSCLKQSLQANLIKHYTVIVKADKYNVNQPLIIDPILQWSTFYGGTSDEDAHTVYNDGVNTWLTGHSQSFNFPTLNPGSGAYYQGSNAGGAGDAFVSKFSTNGNLIWSTYFGGSGNDEALSIFSNGINVWVGGYTNSTDFPLSNPGGGAFYQNTLSALSDGFISKFTTTGQLIWSTYCGGSNTDYVSALHVNNNELYVGATSNSSNYPLLSSGTFTQSYTAGNDGVIMKFNASNNLVWSTFIGGSGNDLISSIQTNSTSIFINGYTNSTNYNILNAGGGAYFQGSSAGGYDGFITKFSLNGTMLWSTYFGGTSTDKYNSLVLDNNFVWLVGTTSSTNLPVFNAGGTSFYQPTNSAFGDIYLTKFDLTGVLKWSTYFGGNVDDYGTLITSDGKNVFVGAYTNSTNNYTLNPGNGSFFQATNAGFYDCFMMQFDSSSTCKWATYFGNISNDYINGIYSDVNNIFITGYTQSVSLPLANPGSGAYYQATNGGSLDAFISKFKNCNNPVPIATVNSPLCVGGNLSLTSNTFAGATYQWFGPQSFNTSVQNPTINNITTNNSGNYSLIVNVPGGCGQGTFISVTVNSLTAVTATNNGPVCAGSSLTLSGSSAVLYSWVGVNSFTSSIQNPVIINTSTLNSGNYTLVATDVNGCTNSATITVIILPLPVISITINTLVCVGSAINMNGGGGQTYNWYGPNSFTATTQNPSIVNTTTINQGYYALTITDANGCKKSDSLYVLVNLCNTINELVPNVNLRLFPNPVTDILYLNGELLSADNLYISIFNIEGKKIVHQKYVSQLNLSTLTEGVYLLKIELDFKTIFSKKFTKSNY